jgi:molecular chaperone DnaJ
VLSDAEKRRNYDQFGHAAFEQGGGPGGFGGGGFSGSFNMGDIFEQFFGGDGYGDIFGGRRPNAGPRKGPNTQVNIQIKFEEAFFGTERELNLNLSEPCDECGGSGAKPGTLPETCKHCGGSGQERVQQQTFLGISTVLRTCSVCGGEGKIVKDPCAKCGGKGKIRKTKPIQVVVPKGIDDGQSLRIAGKGEAGDRGGQNGDLIVNVRVQPSKQFQRDGMTLFTVVPISFVQAALGDEITIPLVDGEEKYTIKAGTQTGSELTLRGKGMPNVRNSKQVGDLIVQLNVVVPTQLNDKQKDALRDFSKAMGEDVKEHKKGWFRK